MKSDQTSSRKAIILWLSGVGLSDIRALPEIVALSDSGAQVELEPAPITGLQAQHFQAAAGRAPASFGLFDTVMPHHYALVEESSGRGNPPLLFPDLLRSAGWNVCHVEVEAGRLAEWVQSWTRVDPPHPSCLIVKTSVANPGQAREMLPALSLALNNAGALTGESNLLAVLSDGQPARVRRYVNLNNFLADMGVIERDEAGDSINWPNSLAYFAGHGQLWLNLLGRDDQGAVHPQDEAEEVRDTLVEALPAKLRDPQTGEPVIEQVYRKEELYDGDYLFCAPDLVVLFAPGYAPSPRSVAISFDAETFTTPAGIEYASAGIHPSSARGFLLASAPAFAPAYRAREPEPLAAATPTLLHALGVHCDQGSVISTLFVPSYLADYPIRSGAQRQDLSSEEEELIIGRLRDLGYV